MQGGKAVSSKIFSLLSRIALGRMLQLLVGTVIFIAATPSHATLITLTGLDFPTSGLNTSNQVNAHGIRMSPNCHTDILGADGIGFDSSSCGSTFNSSFLGPDEFRADRSPFLGPAVWMDYSARSFSLHSLLIPWNMVWVLESSKGGSLTAAVANQNPDGSPLTFLFEGDLWTNIDWIMFRTPVGDDCGEPFCSRFDQVTFLVPQPGAASMYMLGLLLLAVAFTRSAVVNRRALRRAS